MCLYCTSLRIYFSTGKPEANEVPLTDGVDWDAEDDVLSGMTSIAICGIEDPVRPEVSILYHGIGVNFTLLHKEY